MVAMVEENWSKVAGSRKEKNPNNIAYQPMDTSCFGLQNEKVSIATVHF